jgi:enoyl-CoA hydratase/carnithine racemase
MKEIQVETSGRIVTVTLDAPPVNALTVARYAALAEAFEEIGRRSDVHCALLTARGTRAFCAGLDLHEFATWPAERDHERAAAARRTFAAIRRCAIPVIAAVNGPALGAGCVIAACCDIRIAAERASFGLPEINVGRCGGGAHVGRLVPQGMLRKMFFTGRPISAQEAYRVGFVEELVPAEGLLAAAQNLAAVIAGKSPLGLRLGKQALNEAEVLPVEDGYALEQGYSTRLLATEDAREAARSVIEKRPPVFKGR